MNSFFLWCVVAVLVWIMIYGDDSDDEGPRIA
jgi:hypothetical protein